MKELKKLKLLFNQSHNCLENRNGSQLEEKIVEQKCETKSRGCKNRYERKVKAAIFHWDTFYFVTAIAYNVI